MKRRFAIVAISFGLLLLPLLVTPGPTGAALPMDGSAAGPPVGSAVELQPADAGARPGYRNPLLPWVDFLVDDGGMEYQFGLNTQGHGLVLLGLNRFTLSAGQYPLLLTEIRVLFPDVARAHIDLTGRNVDLLVYRDTSGSGQPGNASKIHQSTVQVQTLSPNFSVYPVNIPIQGPGDIYIGFANTYDHGGGVPYSYPFGLDQSQSQQRSWIIGNYNGADPNYNDLSNNQLVSLIDNMGFSYIGNFLIRGRGEVGATPNPTSTPTRTPTAGPTVTRPPAYVLHDQYGPISPIYATNSQQYEPYMQPYTDYLADDFVVPAGLTWYLDEVDVEGRIDGGMGPVDSFNVIVYASGGTVPGSAVYTATNAAYTVVGGGGYHIPLTSPAMLPAGTYWLMVQGNLAYYNAGRFMWYNRAAQSYNQAAWFNPGDGWGTNCTEAWGTRWQCTGDASEPDQVYRLLGTAAGGPTPIASNTPTHTPTRTPTPPLVTSTPTGTGTPPTATITATPTATTAVTPCALEFNDTPPGSTFYAYVRCLACRGIVGGYPCGGPGEPCPGTYYRPNNNVTRGQVSKIVSESAQFSDPVPSTQQTFEDVAPAGTFHLWIERLATRGIIGGYPCGGPFEPCVAPTNRPYFRPNNNVTRGQLSKITSGAAGWTETPTGQTFEDVSPGSTFYLYIERMAGRAVISGYPCGGSFEPCVPPNNRAYFRPNNNATRGQMAKVAAQAFYPNCQTPTRW